MTDRYKWVHFYGNDIDYWELFDRQNDPRDMLSVLDDPEYKQARSELEIELARLRAELKVPKQDPVDLKREKVAS